MEEAAIVMPEAIILNLPGPVYERLKRRAEARHRTLEAEILDAVASTSPTSAELPTELREVVAALPELDDDALWQAARDRLPEEAAAELETLNLKQQREGLTERERETRDRLLRGYERVLLVRAEAVALLQSRGHDVSTLLTGG